jgi:hypothetical protein
VFSPSLGCESQVNFTGALGRMFCRIRLSAQSLALLLFLFLISSAKSAGLTCLAGLSLLS